MVVSKRLSVGLLFVLLSTAAVAQSNTRYTYHDEAKKNLKEIYQVKDTIRNILQGARVADARAKTKAAR